MYTYGCLNTRREPFTTNGRPPPQGGYIQSSSLLSFLSLFLFSKLLSLKPKKLKLLSPKSNGNTCTETRQLSHWTTDAASAILFSASTGGNPSKSVAVISPISGNPADYDFPDGLPTDCHFRSTPISHQRVFEATRRIRYV